MSLLRNDGRSGELQGGAIAFPVVAHDDRSVLYTNTDANGVQTLWIAALDGGEPP